MSNQRKIGVVLSYVSELIKVLSALIYTPIMLRLLGQSEFGLYQLVYSVVSYLSLLSLGFGSSYLRFYSKSKVNNDEQGIAKLNGMFMAIFSVISVVCMLCGTVMIKNVDSIFGTGLTGQELEKAKQLMLLMVINITLTFPNSVFNCIVTANEHFFFQKLLIVLQNVLNPFITLPLLIVGYGSVAMVLVTTTLTFVTLVCNICYCFAKLHTKFSFSHFQLSLFKEMFMFTFFIFLNQIIDQINWSVDKFLLGRIKGTVSVAVYGVGAQINTLYVQASTAISNVFAPQINMIVADTNDSKSLSDVFIKVGRLQFIVLNLILTGFIFFGQPFVNFWAGNGYQEAYKVALFLLVPVTVPLIQNLGIEIQRAKNKHKVRSVVYFLIAIGNVLISIPLIKYFGVCGAAAGTCLALLLGNIIFMNWYYNARLGLDIKRFWLSIVSILPAMVIPCGCGLLFYKMAVFDSAWKLLFGIIMYSIIYTVSMWFFGFNHYEKQIVCKAVSKIKKGMDR